MCGIAGIVATDRLRPEDRAQLLPMGDTIAHRGPDDSGTYVDERAAFVHRRLSIVDLKTGRQPLSNEDGTIWIVFNGEIYNHADLRRTLEAAGHAYHTRSDTETIVHAYEQWGDACVEHLRGMFAFAIWDVPRRRLLLARDRLGVKPLYWAFTGTSLVFGSEIKAILKSGLVVARPNTDAIPELLATRYVSGSETMFTGISKLMPGHLLVFEDGEVRTRQYWDVPVGEPAQDGQPRPRTFKAAVSRFKDLLEESVRLRLMSDVPLGMFLSGGLDSSAVAALMAPMVDHQLQTFSVAFADRAYSELAYARQVVQAVGANGHEIVIDASDFFGALPRLLWHEDEPIAHPSSIPLYFVSQLAREHVTVVLTGEGSDELMAGYGKYPRSVWNWRLGAAWESAVPTSLRRWAAGRGLGLMPSALARYARRSFLAVPHRAGATFFDNFAAIPLAEQRRLLAASLIKPEAVVYGSSLAYFERARGARDVLERLLYTDIKTYLVELLMKQDQMSMAASIESRVPFLDHVLVEYVASLPSAWKLSGLTTKRLLREAVKGLLPPEILERPKMGFPVPFGNWMRGPWLQVARDVLLDRRSRERGVVDQSAMAGLLNAHASGEADLGDRIWSLLNLELWFRTFIDGEGVQTLGVPRPAASANRETLVA